MRHLPKYVPTSHGYDIAHAVSGEGPLLIHLPHLFNHFSRLWSDLYFEAVAAQFFVVVTCELIECNDTRGFQTPCLRRHLSQRR
jgi:hypothetical protein